MHVIHFLSVQTILYCLLYIIFVKEASFALKPMHDEL